MIDQIGGWSKRSVGEGYGEGYSIGQKFRYMGYIADARSS